MVCFVHPFWIRKKRFRGVEDRAKRGPTWRTIASRGHAKKEASSSCSILIFDVWWRLQREQKRASRVGRHDLNGEPTRSGSSWFSPLDLENESSSQAFFSLPTKDDRCLRKTQLG